MEDKKLKHASDQDLLNEIEARFEQKRSLIVEQNRVMSQLNALNEKLSDSEMVKSRFLSNIRNEINNPLASIIGLSNRIFMANNLDETNRKSAKLILEEAQNLSFQLSNIFCAAEIEAGEVELEFINLNVNNMVSEVVEEFSLLSGKNKVKVNVSNNGLDKLVTDAEKLRIVVANLVSNAIKFSPTGSEVDFQLYSEDNLAILELIDNGLGISDEKQNVIFDRFTQINEGTTKRFMGQGLGLSLVKAILDIMGGKVELTSNLGKGSTFKVSIPIAENTVRNSTVSSSGNDFLFDEDDVEEF